MKTSPALHSLREEFAAAELGDSRRVARLQVLVDSAVRQPAASLPEQAGSEAALEGTYRFLGSSEFTAEQVLEPHLNRTAMRAAEHERVLVLHDTTGFCFGGEVRREGLGRLSGKDHQGFYAHYSLAVGGDGCPLGVAALRAWRRSDEPKGRRGPRASQEDPDRESLRWGEAALEVAERLGAEQSAIHVMDREGDSYELFAQLVDHSQRFVIRLAHNRVVGAESGDERLQLFDKMADARYVFHRYVDLSTRLDGGRSAKHKRVNPPRDSRLARLEVRACTAVLQRAKHLWPHSPEALELNFVEVSERPAPDDGSKPVCWRLVTTEPISTQQQVEAIVDAYRQRWLIEEFFKAIKTGCAYERLQLGSAKSLLVALSIYSAVAWRLLLLRWLQRNDGDSPCERVLTPTQVLALRAICKRGGATLPDKPTCSEAIALIAALGGHVSNNGPPGWLTIGRGFHKLLLVELGFFAAYEEIGVPPPK